MAALLTSLPGAIGATLLGKKIFGKKKKMEKTANRVYDEREARKVKPVAAADDVYTGGTTPVSTLLSGRGKIGL